MAPTIGVAMFSRGSGHSRYKVLYANESDFRDSAILPASDKAATEDFIEDKQLGGAAEPGQVASWITHLYADGGGPKLQAVGEIAPGCGHACAESQQCSNGTYKSPPRAGHCCDPCVCADGFTAGACEFSAACEHIAAPTSRTRV